VSLQHLVQHECAGAPTAETDASGLKYFKWIGHGSNDLVDDVLLGEDLGQHVVVKGCPDGQDVDDRGDAVLGDVLDPAAGLLKC